MGFAGSEKWVVTPILHDNNLEGNYLIISRPFCAHCEKDLRGQDFMLVESRTGKAFCNMTCVEEFRVEQVVRKLSTR